MLRAGKQDIVVILRTCVRQLSVLSCSMLQMRCALQKLCKCFSEGRAAVGLQTENI